MMKADSVTKDYMKQSTIFADAFNFLLYGGNQIIDPEKLTSMDPTEIGIIHNTEEKGEQIESVQRYRDVLKSAAIMTDEKIAYLVLGIENQQRVHYAMPVRNGLYDFLQYAGQIQKIARRHRTQKKWKDVKEGEFLSGFYKEDRLIPVITLVIYFQPTSWDGPRRLSEMFREHSSEIRNFIPDYWINLIEPASLTEEDLKRFHTELGKILKFLREANDKDSMHKLVHEDQNYRRISREGARVLSVCAGIKVKDKRKSEVVDVCKAVDDMIKDAVEEKERIIDNLSKDAAEAKEMVQVLRQLLIDQRCEQTGCTREQAGDYIERKLKEG